MSSLTQPRGPLPARVYWVRRGIVLLVALLLVFVIGKVLGGGSDGQGDAGAQAEAASGQISEGGDGEGAGDADQTGSASDEPAQRKGTKGKRGRKAPLAAPDGECDPADITIKPLIGTVGNDGDIDYEVAVTGAQPACTWRFSNETVALKITSGSDLIWTSQHCRKLPTRDVVVRSAVPRQIALSWSGRRSDSECSGTGEWALPGSYHVVAAAMGGEPTDVQFRLTRPPTEVVTVTPKPRPKQNGDEPARRANRG